MPAAWQHPDPARAEPSGGGTDTPRSDRADVGQSRPDSPWVAAPPTSADAASWARGSSGLASQGFSADDVPSYQPPSYDTAAALGTAWEGSYGDAKSRQGADASQNPVLIQPSMPADDGPPVDITTGSSVDPANAPFYPGGGSANDMAWEGLQNPYLGGAGSAYDASFWQQPPAEHPTWDALQLPTNTVRTPRCLVESGLVYDTGMRGFTVGIRSRGYAAAAGGGAGQGTTLTPQQLLDARPDPNCVFVPDRMEWVVIRSDGHMMMGSSEAALNPLGAGVGKSLNQGGSVPVWSSTGAAEIPSEEQAIPTEVLTPLDGSLHSPPASPPASSFVTRWRQHRDVVGGQIIYSSEAGSIPGLIPAALLQSFKEARIQDGGVAGFLASIAALLRIIGNAADGETRSPFMGGTFFTKILKVDNLSLEILHRLGFHEISDASPGADGRKLLAPPDLANPEWVLRLRRAWIEIQAWKLCNSPDPEQLDEPLNLTESTIKCEVVLGSGSDIKRLFGWTEDQDTAEYKNKLLTKELKQAFSRLGATEESSDEALIAAYNANVAANPGAALRLFQALIAIWEEQRPRSDALQFEVASGKSEGKYSMKELEQAYMTVCGLTMPYEELFTFSNDSLAAMYEAALNSAKGNESDLANVRHSMQLILMSRGWPSDLRDAIAAMDASTINVEMDLATARRTLGFEDHEPDDEFIVNMFPILKESTPVETLKRAIGVIAEARDSEVLRQLAMAGENADIAALGMMSQSATWSNGPQPMDLDRAKRLLGFQDSEPDDEFISNIFPAMVMDSNDPEQLREALRVYAEHRNSDALRHLCASEQQAAYSGLPAGLENIGNTCYLNSVLQYFFAIRELRDRVLQYEKLEIVQASDEEVEQRLELRVGGRKVSRREVERSLRFVRYLAQLFSNMIHTPAPAVRPERELAYLALVSSRVEEVGAALASPTSEPKHVAANSDTPADSMATDTTLVDDPIALSPAAGAPAAPSAPTTIESPVQEIKPALGNTIDGAEGAANTREGSAEAAKESEPKSPEAPTPTEATSSEELPLAPSVLAPPPLPPRPKQVPDSSAGQHDAPARQNSLMRLGAQQDVSECLDNVMFQVEVALAPHLNSTSMVTKKEDIEARANGAKEVAEVDDDDAEWSGDSDDILTHLFTGRTCQQLVVVDEPSAPGAPPSKAHSQHSKKEVFKLLPIDVLQEERDIHDGLQGFFDEEILQGSSGKPVRRTVTLLQPLPPVLQIQLQRVQYDRVRGVAFKSKAHLDFGETLFMDRYLDLDPSSAEDAPRLEKRKRTRQARKEVEALRATLAELQKKKSDREEEKRNQGALVTVPTKAEAEGQAAQDAPAAEPTEGTATENEAEATQAAIAAAAAAAAAKAEEAESEALELEIAKVRSQILSLKAEEERLWDDERRAEYVLAAVFMHRGEASHGHFWVYMRCLPEPGKEAADEETPQDDQTWFRYNDNVVTKVKTAEVLRDTSGATPYLLSYVRRDLQQARTVFDPLKRDIEGGGDVLLGGASSGEEDAKDVEMPGALKLPPASDETQTTDAMDVSADESRTRDDAATRMMIVDSAEPTDDKPTGAGIA